MPGERAIKITADGGRRNADVIVATAFKRYRKYPPGLGEMDLGMCFFTKSGTRVANYPEDHSANCTAKHQSTGGKFKPLVRIFKNMRSKLVSDGVIGDGDAPSYFVEGLLYNVPDANFIGSNSTIVFNILTWLRNTPDRTKYVCANEQYYLLRDSTSVCWTVAKCERFIEAAIGLWNTWS